MNEPFISELSPPQTCQFTSIISHSSFPSTPIESFANLSKNYDTDINPTDPEKSKGLNGVQVLENRRKYKENKMTDLIPKKQAWHLIRKLANAFNVLLFFEAVMSFVSKSKGELHVNIAYGIFFLLLIFLNWIVVGYQEHRFRPNWVFKDILPPKCEVIRDGIPYLIRTEDLVPGDLVKIKAGNKIPADLRIITNHDIKIQQSDINGESDCIEGSAKRVDSKEFEMQHIIYAGSKCLEGAGKGVVIKTGDNTYLGELAKASTREMKVKKLSLENQLNKIVIFVIALDILAMVIATLANIGRWEMEFEDFVSISFGNIPQALVLTTTLCLIIVAKRLQSSNIVVKRLDCLESLSSASVVLCDKTGTLTLNRMKVLNLWFNKSIRTNKQVKDTYEHQNQHVGSINGNPLMSQDKTWRIMFKTACICNKAKVKLESEELEGGAADQALLGFCLEIDKNAVYTYRTKYETVVFDIPFKSQRKFQVTVRQYGKEKEKKCLLMKGAPEIVLNHCTTFMHNGETFPLDNKFRKSFESVCTHTFGKKGERILGIAYKKSLNSEEIFTKENCPSNDLTFVGLISFLDPPKPGVADAIKILKEANLKIHMITGDHTSTAECLARNLDILHNTTDNLDEDNDLSVVINGPRLSELTHAQWVNLLKKQEIVFARSSPEDKQLIVRKFKEVGHKNVIMIGDGANDAIALKEADVGIVIGKNCSVISQDVADLIFKDDDFSHIVQCIEQGRVFFDNLKKALAYTLAHSTLEVIPCFLSAAINLPLAISNLQMLMIDLGTEMLPAISVAFHQTKEKIMEKNPRDPEKDTLVSWKLLFHSYVVIGSIELFWCLFAFFMNFAYNNVSADCHVFPGDFYIGIGKHHFVSARDDYLEDWGDCTVEQQKTVLSQVQMAWFTTVVLSQFANCILMVGVKSKMTLFAVGIEIVLLVLLISVPDLVALFFLKDEETPIHYDLGLLLTPWIGSFLCLLLYHKGRRWFLRRHPSGRRAWFLNW